VLRKEKIVGKDNPSQALFHSCFLAYSSCQTLIVLLQLCQCTVTVAVATPSFRRRTRTGGILQAKGEDLLTLSRRQYHIEPGPLEKALLAKDAALKSFKSYKQSVKKLKKIGDILTIVVAWKLRGKEYLFSRIVENSSTLCNKGGDGFQVRKKKVKTKLTASTKFLAAQ
ncbi:hypothetical protein HN51_069676, partial [Arachis hypogaea]